MPATGIRDCEYRPLLTSSPQNHAHSGSNRTESGADSPLVTQRSARTPPYPPPRDTANALHIHAGPTLGARETSIATIDSLLDEIRSVVPSYAPSASPARAQVAAGDGAVDMLTVHLRIDGW